LGKRESTQASSADPVVRGDGEQRPHGDGPDLRDRRKQDDRRARPTSMRSTLLGLSRRRAGRRAGERDGIYVDRFHRSDVLLVLAVFTLNIMDAGFTMAWLQRGGSEGNPLMARLLDLGHTAFLIEKCFVVGVWLLVLLVHKNFRVARIGLRALLVIYGLLFAYHVALVTSGVDPRKGPVPITITLESGLVVSPYLEEPGASEEVREERGNRGLDAQTASPQADALQSRINEPREFMIRPAVLGPDGKHYVALDSARAIDGGTRMGDEGVGAGDQSR
jgi:hypothetical protein